MNSGDVMWTTGITKAKGEKKEEARIIGHCPWCK
jgi:hypothetical protein